MKQNIDKMSVRLATYRALLFNVLSCTRFIFVELKAGHLLLQVYNDRDLTDNEKNIYYAVCGEIEGDFIESILCKVDFLTTREPFERTDQSGDLVYARYEMP